MITGEPGIRVDVEQPGEVHRRGRSPPASRAPRRPSRVSPKSTKPPGKVHSPRPGLIERRVRSDAAVLLGNGAGHDLGVQVEDELAARDTPPARDDRVAPGPARARAPHSGQKRMVDGRQDAGPDRRSRVGSLNQAGRLDTFGDAMLQPDCFRRVAACPSQEVSTCAVAIPPILVAIARARAHRRRSRRRPRTGARRRVQDRRARAAHRAAGRRGQAPPGRASRSSATSSTSAAA